MPYDSYAGMDYTVQSQPPSLGLPAFGAGAAGFAVPHLTRKRTIRKKTKELLEQDAKLKAERMQLHARLGDMGTPLDPAEARNTAARLGKIRGERLSITKRFNKLPKPASLGRAGLAAGLGGLGTYMAYRFLTRPKVVQAHEKIGMALLSGMGV